MGGSTASRPAFDIDETASFANPGMGFFQVGRMNDVPAVSQHTERSEDGRRVWRGA